MPTVTIVKSRLCKFKRLFRDFFAGLGGILEHVVVVVRTTSMAAYLPLCSNGVIGVR